MANILLYLSDLVYWCRHNPMSVQLILLGGTGIFAIRYSYEILMGIRKTGASWYEVIAIVIFSHMIRNLL